MKEYYDVYTFGTLNDCHHLKGVKISSLYCTHDCEFCSNLKYVNNRNSFTCNYIEMKRKEKLEKLKAYEKR